MNLDVFVKESVVLCLFSLFLSACGKNEDGGVDSEIVMITPTVFQKVEPINSFTPEHVANLTKIVIAIEKYKQEHRSYPLSSKTTESWDRIYTKTGDVNSAWLNVLAPKYIDAIPIITSESNPPQYAYKSNGANYKLLVLKPKDCEYVKSKKPDLIDPHRDCRAYGFWTDPAASW